MRPLNYTTLRLSFNTVSLNTLGVTGLLPGREKFNCEGMELRPDAAHDESSLLIEAHT